MPQMHKLTDYVDEVVDRYLEQSEYGWPALDDIIDAVGVEYQIDEDVIFHVAAGAYDALAERGIDLR